MQDQPSNNIEKSAIRSGPIFPRIIHPIEAIGVHGREGMVCMKFSWTGSWRSLNGPLAAVSTVLFGLSPTSENLPIIALTQAESPFLFPPPPRPQMELGLSTLSKLSEAIGLC